MNAWLRAVEVVNQCLLAGIGEFVVCAGAHNAALLEALSRAEAAGNLKLWRHFEERSAGFFALGRTMETGAPCAVVTTSGTAVAELLPAVIEARYQMRPLVALTADRPEVFRHCGAPQAINQIAIFGDYAARCALVDWDGFGPLHWNIEFEEEFHAREENFSRVSLGEFNPVRERIDVAELARWLREDHYRGIVVMVGGLEPQEREEVFHFCRDFESPVVVDATSGLREALHGLSIHDADRVLKARPPQKILRIGDVPSGRFWRDLESLNQVAVWSVTRSGLPGLARDSHVTRGCVARILKAMGDLEPAEDAMDYLVGASGRAARLEELLECYPDSEPAMVRTLSQYASIGSGIFLGNSLPIREWNAFAQWSRLMPNVRANRGANGIDGQISSWLGWSATVENSWALIGDLTALYDVSAGFLLGQVNQNGRVLAVINNHGGGIFKRLPRLQEMSARAKECMINPHQVDLSGIAKIWGMKHIQIGQVDDFDRIEESATPILLELVPDAKQTESFWSDYAKFGV